MNTKLVDSLWQIIRSLEPAEFELLNERIKRVNTTEEITPKNDFLTPNERLKAIQEWAESHSHDTPLLSDYAVSRAGIYEED